MSKKIVGIVILFIIFVIVIFINNGNDYTVKSVDYNGSNLMISIDGESSNTLPTSGSYYLASYDCESDETKISWNKNSYELKVSNGKKKSGVSCYLDFQTNPLLYNMEEGSYVEYVGDNGCPEGHCDGTNANYVNDTDMGYCNSDDYKFITNGWRIAYKKNGSAYLISAGAPECMCSDQYGVSNTSCSNAVIVSEHIANLDEESLKYCNTIYAFGGVCDNTTTWSINANDFKFITGNNLSNDSCFGSRSTSSCGYSNDLIDIGSDYWFGTFSSEIFFWSTQENPNSNYISRTVSQASSIYLKGIRPVIKLDSNVVVTGGSGTYENPYSISNNTFNVDEASLVSNGNSRNVTLSLIALDTVEKVCVNVDSSSCSNYVNFPDNNIYSLDLSSYDNGEKTLYVYYKDAAGKVVASMNKTVTLS